MMTQESDTIEKTRESFGWEWQKWTQLPDFEADFLGWTNKTADFFYGKVGVDVGCGTGRFAEKAAHYVGSDGLVVAVDSSDAIYVAKEKVRGLPAEVVKADLRYLPFRQDTFDFLYIIGVIQHVPSPEKIPEILVKFVKPGGYFLGTVYSAGSSFLFVFSQVLVLLRRFSLRLSYPAVVVLSEVLAVPSYVVLKSGLPQKVFGYAAEKKSVLPSDESFANPDYKLLVHKWFDNLATPIVKMYPPSEISRWFSRAGISIESDQASLKLGVVRGRRG